MGFFLIVIINLKTFNRYIFFKFLLSVHFNFRCYPRLNEGDQVVMINNRDVSQHTHDQVVNFIRASSEPHSAQLILAVRQVSLIRYFLILVFVLGISYMNFGIDVEL